METSVECLKNWEAQKVNMLEVKVIKKVSENFYIVGDKKGHVLLESEQGLKEGTVYKLIKPLLENMGLRRNPKFAAIKMEKDIKTKTLNQGEEDKLCESIKKAKCVPKINNNFKLVDALGVGSVADRIKVMVVNRSSVIAGKFGNYRIITCKDVMNQKNSINLSKNLMNMVEVGEIYTITKIKVSNFKKEDTEFRRVGTTFSSKIIKGTADDKVEFEIAEVTLGDKAARGTILGISELKVYESCVVCWCKVDADNECRKCMKKVEDKKADFNLVMYVGIEDDNNEVLDLFCFKSTLNLKDIDEMDVSEENLNKVLEGKMCQVEYDVDKNGEDEKLRLVRFGLDSA